MQPEQAMDQRSGLAKDRQLEQAKGQPEEEPSCRPCLRIAHKLDRAARDTTADWQIGRPDKENFS